MSVRSVLAEIMGKADGCAGGLGGSMHLCDPDVGLLPTFAIVGAGLPVAAGAALAFQTRGEPRVAVAMFGDGATNIGAFHEALNLAAIWRLPVVFVCDNNVYGEYTRIDLSTPLQDPHLRAQSYAMPHEAIDGMDVATLRVSLGVAVAKARDGGGPTLLEAKTYRFAGHSRADKAEYRPEGELERWLVKITSLDGQVGWGEAITQFRVPRRKPGRRQAHRRDRRARGGAGSGADRKAVAADEESRLVVRLWRRDGLLRNRGGDMALWDLKGHALGRSVLLGGPAHERLPAVASCHAHFDSIPEMVDEAVGWLSNGLQGVKVGFGKRGNARLGYEHDRDVEYVQAIREALGPDPS